MLKKAIILYFFLCFGPLAKAQNNLNFEFFGGPSINWLQASTAITSPNSKVETANPIQFNFGITSLFRISPRWQITAEMELSKVPFNVLVYSQLSTGFTTTTSINKTNLTNFRIGSRYAIDREKISYYFQPALGISISSNRFNDESDSTLNRTNNLQNVNPLSLTAKGELGVKFFDR